MVTDDIYIIQFVLFKIAHNMGIELRRIYCSPGPLDLANVYTKPVFFDEKYDLESCFKAICILVYVNLWWDCER